MQEKEFTKITNRGQLRNILNQIRNRNAMLNISFENNDNKYSSALLDIDEKKKFLKLDELNPQQGHDLIQKNSIIKVHCRHPGSESTFKLKVNKVDIENDIFYYLTSIPTEIDYYQRRNSLRVSPALTLEPDIVIFSNGFHTTGKIHNISYSGVGGILEGPSISELNETYTIQISLNTEAPIITPITMKFIGAAGHRGIRRFGATFTNLSPDDEQRITNMVNKIQRYYIRRGNITT